MTRYSRLGTSTAARLAGAVLLAGAASFGAGSAAAVQDGTVWQVLELPGLAPARFTLPSEDLIRIETDSSVGFLYREVAGDQGKLTWRWRVDECGPIGDLMRKGEDDRPLAVHLWFPDEAEDFSFNGLLGDLFGYPVFGRAITYVWAPDTTKGKRFDNPHLETGQGVIIVLRDRRDGWGRWQYETVDYAADYARHFGTAAPMPRFVAISGDSDDLGGMTLGWVAELRFWN